LYGISLADADRVARVAIPGVRRDDPRRSRALVRLVLADEARNGHTITPRPVVSDALAEFGIDPDAAVDAALRAKVVTAVASESLALPSLAEAEEAIAAGITRLLDAAEPIAGKVQTKELDATQRSAVAAALEQGVTVLTGGPGTGKSRTVATLVR